MPAAKASPSLARWAYPLLAVAVFTLYLPTLAPALTAGDGPEIVTAVVKLGVIHPTGYPLFTLLGHLFVRALPASLAPCVRIEIMNAACGAGASLFAALAARALAGRIALGGRAADLGGLLAGAALGAAPLVWSQVRLPEVYALHLLLAAWAVYALARFEAEEEDRWLIAAAVPMGLGLAHHVTMIYVVAAATLYALARRHAIFWHWAAAIGVRAVRLRRPDFAAGARFPAASILPIAGAALLLPLALYAYLLWATAHTTAIAWGAPQDWDTLYRHVTAKQYQRYLASAGFGAHLDRVRALPAWLLGELGAAGVIAALGGMIALARRAWRPAVMLAVVLALNLAHGCYYGVTDYEAYFAPALIPAAIFAGIGLAFALSRARAATALGAAAALAQLGVGVARAGDLGRDEVVTETFGAEATALLGPGAVLLVQGDGLTGTMWYEQHALGRGVDVAAIDAGNLWTWWHQGYYASHYPAACDPLAFGGDRPAYEARCGSFARRMAMDARFAWFSLGLDPPPPGAVLELPSARVVRGDDPRCVEHAFRAEHTLDACGCHGYAARGGKLAERCVHAAEEGGVVPRPPLEMFVERVIEDHLDERPVFERNVLTHKQRPEAGPTFHRVSGELGLLNRGLVNQVLYAADLAKDTCAADEINRVRPRLLEPARARPRPPDRRRVYQPNDVPTLIASSFLAPSLAAREGEATRSFQAGEPVYLHVDWLERAPVGVRVCAFDPDGKRIAARALRAGKTGPILLFATSPGSKRGAYTIAACATGPIGEARAPAASEPCTRAILEVELTLR